MVITFQGEPEFFYFSLALKLLLFPKMRLHLDVKPRSDCHDFSGLRVNDLIFNLSQSGRVFFFFFGGSFET